MANSPFTVSEALAQRDQNDVLPSAVTVGASPYTYTNPNTYPVDLLVTGGTVTSVFFSRDGVTSYDTGGAGRMFGLSSGDQAIITYTVLPTVTAIPR